MDDLPKGSLRKQARLILNLGKYRVIERNEHMMTIGLGGTTTLRVSIPPVADVRAGDVLTLYTEVLFDAGKPTGDTDVT